MSDEAFLRLGAICILLGAIALADYWRLVRRFIDRLATEHKALWVSLSAPDPLVGGDRPSGRVISWVNDGEYAGLDADTVALGDRCRKAFRRLIAAALAIAASVGLWNIHLTGGV